MGYRSTKIKIRGVKIQTPRGCDWTEGTRLYKKEGDYLPRRSKCFNPPNQSTGRIV